MRTILYSDYLEAKTLVDAYTEQMKYSVTKIEDLSLEQKVFYKQDINIVCWVTEIKGEDVLLRTAKYETDPGYDDMWVNISDIRLIK